MYDGKLKPGPIMTIDKQGHADNKCSHQIHYIDRAYCTDLNCFQTEVYSEPCQTSEMERSPVNISLREKCPKAQFFLVCIFLYSVRIQENKDQKKLRSSEYPSATNSGG